MRLLYLPLILLTFLVYSCATGGNGENSESKTEKKDTVKTSGEKKDTSEKSGDYGKIVEYNAFVLIKSKESGTLTVFINPDGKAKSVAEKILPAFEEFNSNVICLKNVKDNMQGYEDTVKKDIELFSKYTAINPGKIYIVGFSGAARMAQKFASKNEKINGVVMCGAGLGKMIENYSGAPIVYITGNADPNFNEQYYSPYSSAAANKNILGIVFDGTHKWPEVEYLAFAINYLKGNKDFFNYDKLYKTFEELKNSKDYYSAFKTIEAVNKIFDTDQTRKDFKSFVSLPDFKSFVEHFEKILLKEFDRNNMLSNMIYSGDLHWWNSKIDEINEKIGSTKDKYEKLSYERTKYYLILILNSAIKLEKNKTNSKYLEKFTKILEKLEG